MKDEPLLTEQLNALIKMPLSGIALAEMERTDVTVLGIPITRLIAEVRRLREIVRDAEEIGHWAEDGCGAEVVDHADLLAILRGPRS